MIDIDIEIAKKKSKAILSSIGFSQKEIKSILNSWIFASLSEKYSHGFDRIPWLYQLVLKGKITPNSKIIIENKNSLVSNIVGKRSLGYLAAEIATSEAISITKKNGVGFATAYDTYPTGCMGQYVNTITDHGYIGLVITHSTKRVSPFQGNSNVFSTCGHSFGFPSNNIPYIYDSSVGSITNGQLMIYHKNQKDLPEETVLTESGTDTTKVNSVFDHSGIFNGIIKIAGGINAHKFSGLAGSHELLTQLATLNKPKNISSYSFFMSIDPNLFGEINEYKNLVSEFQKEIKSSNTKGNKVYFAGEQSYLKREKNKNIKQISITKETQLFLDKF